MSGWGARRRARRSAVRVLDACGLGSRWSSGDELADAARLGRRLPAFADEGDPDAPRILIVGTRALSGLTPRFVGLLWHALRIHGANPVVVLCDHALEACESLAATDYDDLAMLQTEGREHAQCLRCFEPTRALLEAMGVEWLPLSVAIEQARASSWTEAQRVCSLSDAVDCEWRGIGIGEHVRTSLLRFYLTAELTDNESSRMVAQKYVDAGVEVAAAADYLLDEHRPECVVAHHGIYLVGGVFLEVARARDVRVAAYDGTYRSNCIVISHGDTYHHELRSEPTTFWEDRELDPFQEQRLDEYTRARRSGAAPQDHITYHPNPVNDLEKVQDALCLDPERLTVALFTNVAWDGQVHVPDAIFSGPLDWLRESLRVLAEEPEYNVVIRVHPAEVKNADWVSQQRADDEVKQWYPELPTHFRLIEAESDLNSYAVARLAVGAAVYSTKIGLELLLMGLPVLVAGDAFYGGKGLAIEPSSRLEYDTELRELGRQSPLPPEQLMRVRRYAYHYYFRRALGVPSFSDSGSGPRLRSLGELAPGKYPDLDVVARGLLTGSPFVSDQC